MEVHRAAGGVDDEVGAVRGAAASAGLCQRGHELAGRRVVPDTSDAAEDLALVDAQPVLAPPAYFARVVR